MNYTDYKIKAKTCITGQWIEGCGVVNSQGMLCVVEICNGKLKTYPVRPETISPFLGMKAATKDGKGVYANDIAKLDITEELMRTLFSCSNLGKAAKEEGLSAVLLKFEADLHSSGLRYEVYYEKDGELVLDEDGKPEWQARGGDCDFPMYVLSKGARVVGNTIDNSELLQPRKERVEINTSDIYVNLCRPGYKEFLCPLEDYLDREAYKYGYDSYSDLLSEGLSIDIPEDLCNKDGKAVQCDREALQEALKAKMTELER